MTNKTTHWGIYLVFFYLGKFRGFAGKLAKGPRVQRVDGRRKWNGEDEDKKVTQRQIEDERVGNAAHRLVTTQDVDERTVANDSNQKNDGEHDGYDIRLGTILVLDVTFFIFFIFVHRRPIRFVHSHRFVHHLVQHRERDLCVRVSYSIDKIQ